ncbi:MAG: acetyl-CoA carboxylase carboxyltransferase subunit beta [Candidatus Marinimicrobia bacterium]|jgi:acetyl-CoA carboxylase carboxyl transferase subunit beta|nr:acetyl-CoA carboxylase carboxyltransferase subunit beta [Candidatus Neomarinimicrobiota bacterium]MBT3630589.1 acetyl-CoA carboxylase carboxyltransferase subunit beta [Candidatus Neomarinimicrobiota bacterium]MBT3825304.1 acetyl-CoA carboxylase carboxyltransferase subunit beta [Candidatus Neomarinimicrobiota bacterium]MBT4129456.1 acetyl-CoA carboxylase carboxyltransferase subunit beta [Candidatus Neomarinimicrobiota bacterium]MBT4295739.1 acetyl-CoA carboxylase carboxyltransferase subunit b
MSWFRRKDKNIQTQSSEKKDIQEGLWVKCPSCRQILYKAELMQSNNVCYKCGYHFRIPASSYIDLLLDTEGRQRYFQNIKPLDPLKFKAQKKYSDQLSAAQQRTGHNEAVQVFEGLMFEKPIVIAVMDFSFIGGSMGSAVGELLAKSADLAREKKIPLIIVSASGGARMMEGAYSLMQMAKTSAKLSQLADAKIPYISIMTDPTTGGVTASFAMLGDVNIAEPGALIGFAGQRVIKQTIGADLPEGFQRAEFLLEKGFLDLIVPRDDLKQKVAEILDILHAKT